MAEKQMCPHCFEEAYENGRCRACGWSEGTPRKDPNILPVGTVLNNRYVLGKVFGRGGFGITYLACDLRHGDLCAVKEYFPGHLAHRDGSNPSVQYSYSNEEDYLYGKKQFFHEARTLYMLKGVRSVVKVKEYFDAVVTACEVAHGKPEPDIYLEVAKRLGVQPEKCLVFEDIPAGIMAGKAAGMPVIAVEDDFSADLMDEKRELADAVISDYRELL